MDWEIVFYVLLVLLVAIALAMPIASMIMDVSSISECKIAGYENGDQYFWQGKTVCWNVTVPAVPEKRQYFVLP